MMASAAPSTATRRSPAGFAEASAAKDVLPQAIKDNEEATTDGSGTPSLSDADSGSDSPRLRRSADRLFLAGSVQSGASNFAAPASNKNLRQSLRTQGEAVLETLGGKRKPAAKKGKNKTSVATAAGKKAATPTEPRPLPSWLTPKSAAAGPSAAGKVLENEAAIAKLVPQQQQKSRATRAPSPTAEPPVARPSAAVASVPLAAAPAAAAVVAPSQMANAGEPVKIAPTAFLVNNHHYQSTGTRLDPMMPAKKRVVFTDQCNNEMAAAANTFDKSMPLKKLLPDDFYTPAAKGALDEAYNARVPR